MKTRSKKTSKQKAAPAPVCKLSELLSNFQEAKKSLSKSLMRKPVPPVEKTSYTVAEWNSHVKAVGDFREKAQRYNEMVAAGNKRIEESRQALEKYIPTAHAWFITEDKRFAVALHLSDWPGDRGNILIRENPVIDELPELRRQIIN